METIFLYGLTEGPHVHIRGTLMDKSLPKMSLCDLRGLMWSKLTIANCFYTQNEGI